MCPGKSLYQNRAVSDTNSGLQVLPPTNILIERWPNTSIIFNPTSCPIFALQDYLLVDPGKLSQIVEATNQCQRCMLTRLEDAESTILSGSTLAHTSRP